MAPGNLAADALEEALAIAGVGCWVWDSSSRSCHLSANFHQLLGYTVEALPETPEAWLTLTHPDERKLLAELFEKLTANEACDNLKLSLRLRHASGMWFWFEVRSRRQHPAEGHTSPILLTFSDVTQQKQSEAALRDSQLRYRALYATSPMAFVLWDRQGRISEWNRRAEKLFGWNSSEVIGRPVHRLLLQEEQHETFRTTIKAMTQGAGDGNFSAPAIAKDGLLRHCNWYNVALRAPSGSLIGILSLILDVTDEYIAHQRLEKSEKVYRTLVETSPDAILLLGLDGRLNMANQQANRLFGLDELAEHSQTNLHDLLPTEQSGEIDFLDNPDDYTGFIVNRELRMRQLSGQDFDAAIAITTLMDSLGQSTGTVLFARDITERLRSERELETHRQNLERLVSERTIELEATRASLAMIIDGSPVPTLVLDANHHVTHWNLACERMIGISASEIVGTRNQWKAFYPSERPIMADLVMQQDVVQLDAIYGGKYRRSLVIENGFEGEDFFPGFNRWLFFTAAPLLDKHGHVIGAIETLQDVSERKQAEDAMLVAKSVAEAAASTKADFLANMSHEIRTPMNAVIGLALLLLKTELTVKQRDYITRIQGAGQMLLGLINDILDFSKIEAGQMSLETVDFRLDDVLSNVTTIVQNRAQEKGLELHYVVAPDVPPNLLGDPLRLAQILVNLIGNSIKFTARGAVNVFIQHQLLSAGEIVLEIAVQDSGIGMTPAQQEKLFHAFSQGDASITRKYGGSGLGLTICKRLCKLMQGDITVSSTPARGSTFSFTVQLGIGAAQKAAERPALRRVLVVDDNPLARTVLARLLEKAGCQTVAVESGNQALEAIADNKLTPFDCVTIDLNMPGMDGIELADAINGLLIKPPPRLVMVTSSDTNDIEETNRLAGFEAILHKPVTAAQIARLVSAQSHEFAPSEAHGPGLLAGISILLVEDIPTNQLIATEILESFGATVKVVDNGRLAVEKILAQGRQFDIVLMDLQMPEMDGLEATRRIRASGKFPDLPIIAMTAHALENEKLRCTQAGMDDFLSKPIDPIVLQQVLLRWKPGAATPEKITAIPPSTATDSQALPDLPGIDTTEGLRRMMNKQRLYERILRDFHERFVNEAALIRQLLDDGDRETAQRSAHSTKGLAGSIGAQSLQDASLALEKAIADGAPDLETHLATYTTELATVTNGIADGFKLT